MAENFALYARTYDALPDKIMQGLGKSTTPVRAVTSRGLTYTYEWPDLKVIVSVMPPEQVDEHLRGFVGYVSHIYKGTVPKRGQAIIDLILQTRLVVGFEVQPQRDAEGRAEQLLGSMCAGLHPIMFYSDALFDWMSRLMLGPDGSFDKNAELDGKKW